MNKTTLVFLSLLAATQVSCGIENGPLVTINTLISDEDGEPVEGAKVTAGFRGVTHAGDLVSALTDEQGAASVSGNTPFSVRLSVEKDNFYKSEIPRIETSNPSLEAELEPRERSAELTLRAVKDPIALIARKMEYEIPIKDAWVGFDLEASDWVKPHGNGETEDVSIRYTNQFLGYNISAEGLEKVRKREARTGKDWTEGMAQHFYGNWSGEVEMKFSGEDEGIVQVAEGYLQNSEMKMPHWAFEEGYQRKAAWTGSMPRSNPILYQGYFLRLRVVKRGDEIIKANYAKINDEIIFDPRGTITFSYCYNPTVNDRNLEFDPERNLLHLDRAAERVRLP